MNKTAKLLTGVVFLAGAVWLWLRRSGGAGGGSPLAGSPSGGGINIGEIHNATTIAPVIQQPGDAETLEWGGKSFRAFPQIGDFAEYMGKGVASANTGSNLLSQAQAAWRAKFGG